MQKKCYKCKEVKDFSEFNSDKGKKYGLEGVCRKCRKSYRDNHTEERSKCRKSYIKRLRNEILDHYGRKCNCPNCDYDIIDDRFLMIDHVNNDGAEHRREIGNGGGTICLWLIKNNFPEGFQILCANCNHGKRMNNGICPHEEYL